MIAFLKAFKNTWQLNNLHLEQFVVIVVEVREVSLETHLVFIKLT